MLTMAVRWVNRHVISAESGVSPLFRFLRHQGYIVTRNAPVFRGASGPVATDPDIGVIERILWARNVAPSALRPISRRGLDR